MFIFNAPKSRRWYYSIQLSPLFFRYLLSLQFILFPCSLCKQLNWSSCYCNSIARNFILVEVLKISLADCVLFHTHAVAEEFWCLYLQNSLTRIYPVNPHSSKQVIVTCERMTFCISVILDMSNAVQCDKVSFHLSDKTFSSRILVYELSLPSGFCYGGEGEHRIECLPENRTSGSRSHHLWFLLKQLSVTFWIHTSAWKLSVSWGTLNIKHEMRFAYDWGLLSWPF